MQPLVPTKQQCPGNINDKAFLLQCLLTMGTWSITLGIYLSDISTYSSINVLISAKKISLRCAVEAIHSHIAGAAYTRNKTQLYVAHAVMDIVQRHFSFVQSQIAGPSQHQKVVVQHKAEVVPSSQQVPSWYVISLPPQGPEIGMIPFHVSNKQIFLPRLHKNGMLILASSTAGVGNQDYLPVIKLLTFSKVSCYNCDLKTKINIGVETRRYKNIHHTNSKTRQP